MPTSSSTRTGARFGRTSGARRSAAGLAALTLVVGLASVAFAGKGLPASSPAEVRNAPAPVIVNEEFLVPEDNQANWPSDVWIVQLETPALARHPEAVRTATGSLDIEASEAVLTSITDEQDDVLGKIRDLLGRDVQIETVTSELQGDAEQLAAIPADQREITYEFRYEHAFNGFAIRMSREEADAVATIPEIRQIQANFMRFPTTDAGPEWIGADDIWGGDTTVTDDDPCGEEPAAPAEATGEPFPGATCGEGVLVGIIDTGVNTNHVSFADVGPVDGYDHFNNHPSGGFFNDYYGDCNVIVNLYCNDKLIGAYNFAGAGAAGPEDENGHGSHTASTSAGNVIDADLDFPTIDYEAVRISGVAPHANIISYKACIYPFVADAGACVSNQTVLAIDQAVADGVDVINYSIGGGPSDPYGDSDSLAFLAANEAEIFGSVSAGNDGPFEATVGSPANSPWVMSVAASTHDRAFQNALVEMASTTGTPPEDLEGLSITCAYPDSDTDCVGDGTAPIVWAGDHGPELCAEGTSDAAINPFTPGTFDGEIVVCMRSMGSEPGGRVQKCQFVGEAGAGGCILLNRAEQGNSIVADTHAIPAVHLTYADGQILLDWLLGPDTNPDPNVVERDESQAAAEPVGQIRGTTLDEDPTHGDVMAGFSSRGPNAPLPDVIKPDVTAPGVDILAAWRDLPNDEPPSPATGGDEFNVISGTSMSSPHDAGAAAVIRGIQPEWKPDQIKSAMMMTSFLAPPGTDDQVHPVINDDLATLSDPFDRGAGRIDISLAQFSGLLMQEEIEAYELSDPGADEPGDPTTLNIPSFGDATCSGTCSWTRTLQSAVDSEVTWTSLTSGQEGLAITVSPGSFTLAGGGTQEISVTADVTGASICGWTFGDIFLIPDDETVPVAHFPVAVFVEACDVELVALHFHGNAHAPEEAGEADCTGVGQADYEAACGGPYLLESPEMFDGDAAHWGPIPQAVDGTSDRNPYDPNWTWCLSDDPEGEEESCPAGEGTRRGPTTVGGPMTVHWWASAFPAGEDVGEFFHPWIFRVFADGELAFTSNPITATPAQVGLPGVLEASMVLPQITAEHTIVLQVDVWSSADNADQQGSFIYYDGTSFPTSVISGDDVQDEHDLTCCDSYVLMPVVGAQASPSPTVSVAPTPTPTGEQSPAATATPRPSPTVRFIPDTAFEWAVTTPEGMVTASSLLILLGSVALLAAPKARRWLASRR